MKHLNQFITEYIVKKKLDKAIDSEDHYDHFPESKEELTEIIHTLLDKGETNLNGINTSKITDMSDLFKDINVNFDISKWDVSNANNMDFMFYSCENFNCDLSSWDVSNVKNMMCMFKFCKNFTGEGLENWNISNVTHMNDIFGKCTLLKNKPSWYKE